MVSFRGGFAPHPREGILDVLGLFWIQRFRSSYKCPFFFRFRMDRAIFTAETVAQWNGPIFAKQTLSARFNYSSSHGFADSSLVFAFSTFILRPWNAE